MLAEAAAGLGFSLSQSEVAVLERYREMLLAAQFNVIGYDAPEDVDRHLLVDALAAWRVLPRYGALSIVDLGTGGGVPGIPLAVTGPNHHYLLVDSREKKVTFVRACASALGLDNVVAQAARAEDLGRSDLHREQHDVVVAKGLAPLNVLLELAVPLLKPDGRLLAWKGARGEEEISAAAGATRALAVEVERVDGYDGAKLLVVVRRVGSLAKTYPRKPALMQKKPL
ncbi:MAG: 16S rRNA (guanine(527)-N(7))-methyltransferase RsmG [Armatimonadetes bacterium]|nr:16S rRNA (guanine(527)-N(7))-methyltransferase RsmG [Armatimonadota bacterium]